MKPALELEDLQVRFGRKRVLNEVSLSIERGTITALLGPNGAGKSTLLRAALGVLRPARGRVRVLGEDPRRGPARRAIGYVADGPDAYGWMTAEMLFRFLAPQYPRWDTDRARALTTRLAVPLRTRLDALSRGQAAKVMLAAALAQRPALLLLDEPFGGLDPEARDGFLAALFAEVDLDECAVLAATHDLAVAARLADRVVTLRGGRVGAHLKLEDVQEGGAPVPALRALLGDNLRDREVAA